MSAMPLEPEPKRFATLVGTHRCTVLVERDHFAGEGTVYWVTAGEPGFVLVRCAICDDFGNLVLAS